LTLFLVFPSRSEAEQESDKIFEDPIENKMPKDQSDYHSNHKDQSNGRYNDNYDDDYNEEKPVNSVVSSWSGTCKFEKITFVLFLNNQTILFSNQR